MNRTPHIPVPPKNKIPRTQFQTGWLAVPEAIDPMPTRNRSSNVPRKMIPAKIYKRQKDLLACNATRTLLSSSREKLAPPSMILFPSIVILLLSVYDLSIQPHDALLNS